MNRHGWIGALLIALGAWSGIAPAEPDIANGHLVAVGGGSGGAQTACFTCHGMDGVGDATGAFPRLAGQSAFYLYKQMQDYAGGSRPNDIMTPIAQALTQAEWEDVSAYYASLTDAPYAPPPEVDPQVLQRGGQLSAIGSAEHGVQACVNCHGPGGIGLPPSVPYLAGQYARYMELQFALWKDGVRANDPLGVMADIARRMTDEDIRAVSLYLEAVRPGPAQPPAQPAQQAPGTGE